MEKSLDATATTTSVEPQIAQPPLSSQPPSLMPSQTAGPSSAPSSTPASAFESHSEIIDQALNILTAEANRGVLSEDELLAASLLFTRTSEDIVRIARTFITLSSNEAVRHRFILRQLQDAGFLQGKGKGKDTGHEDDILM